MPRFSTTELHRFPATHASHTIAYQVVQANTQQHFQPEINTTKLVSGSKDNDKVTGSNVSLQDPDSNRVISSRESIQYKPDCELPLCELPLELWVLGLLVPKPASVTQGIAEASVSQLVFFLFYL